MTNNEMNLLIAELAVKCNVTQEEAKAALEASSWNKLTAGQMLEDEKLRKAQEIEEVLSNCEAATAQAVAEEASADDQAAATENAEEVEEPAKAGNTMRAEGRKHWGSEGLKNLGDHIRRLVACGNRNRFVVRRSDATLLELPVTVMVAFMLFAFWTCVPLLVIGLFLGCRYSFNGKDLGKESINNALDRAATAAEHMKKTVAEA